MRIFSCAFVLPAMIASLSITAFSSNKLCENLNDGLVARWVLNSVEENLVRDRGPKKLHAIANSVGVVDGRGNRVAAFGGVDSSISLPGDKALEFTGDYGVPFWVRVYQGREKNAPILASRIL